MMDTKKEPDGEDMALEGARVGIHDDIWVDIVSITGGRGLGKCVVALKVEFDAEEFAIGESVVR